MKWDLLNNHQYFFVKKKDKNLYLYLREEPIFSWQNQKINSTIFKNGNCNTLKNFDLSESEIIYVSEKELTKDKHYFKA